MSGPPPSCPRCGSRKVRDLSAIERATLAAVEARGECGGADLRAAFPDVTHEALCMRLDALTRRGLLVRMRRAGRRSFFRAAAPDDCAARVATELELYLAPEAAHAP